MMDYDLQSELKRKGLDALAKLQQSYDSGFIRFSSYELGVNTLYEAFCGLDGDVKELLNLMLEQISNAKTKQCSFLNNGARYSLEMIHQKEVRFVKTKNGMLQELKRWLINHGDIPDEVFEKAKSELTQKWSVKFTD